MPKTANLQEVLLVEHFREPLPLTILDIADWAREFAEFSVSLQLFPAAPVELNPVSTGVQFQLLQSELPRLYLRTETGERTVQIQGDRFAYGWSRGATPITEEVEYPGFDELTKQWHHILTRFLNWCKKRIGIIPRPKLVELGYNNATPLFRNGQKLRISEIFKWVQPGRPLNAFQVSWMEFLEEGRADAPRINALVALGAAPPVLQALIFNFTGFFPAGSDDERPFIKHFISLHNRISEMYDATISL